MLVVLTEFIRGLLGTPEERCTFGWELIKVVHMWGVPWYIYFIDEVYISGL
jgi:hypothetical protein